MMKNPDVMVLVLPLLKGEACCETAWQPRGKQSLKPASIMHFGFSNNDQPGGPLMMVEGVKKPLMHTHAVMYKDTDIKDIQRLNYLSKAMNSGCH